jgi:hypothetical protein
MAEPGQRLGECASTCQCAVPARSPGRCTSCRYSQCPLQGRCKRTGQPECPAMSRLCYACGDIDDTKRA